MGILQNIAKVLAYPKSVALGFTGAAPGMMGGERYSEGGRTTTGDLDFLKEGLKGRLSASDITDRLSPDRKDTAGAKIFNTLIDVGYDPLLFTGPLVKGATAGTKVAPLIEGASTFGKISKAEDAAKYSTLMPKAGQALRRLHMGTQATGDLGTGVAAAALMGLGENTAAKILPKIAALTLKGANSNGIGLDDAINNVDELISRPALNPNAIEKYSDSVEAQLAEVLPTRVAGALPSGRATRYPPPVDDELTVFLQELMAGKGKPRYSSNTNDEVTIFLKELMGEQPTLSSALIEKMQQPTQRRNIIDLLAE